MLKVGLTGGIGSGKSTVAKVFEVLGVPVYYADDAARQLMNTNEEIRSSILRHFGEEAYTHNELNRKYLASIVFSNKEKLDLLNSLTHPITIRDAEEWMNRQTSPYVIKEAALLFETAAAAQLDTIVGVYAPQQLRIKRVMDRDGLPAEEVIRRISRQINEEMKMKLCDHVITNNEQELVIPQVLALHHRFCAGNK